MSVRIKKKQNLSKRKVDLEIYRANSSVGLTIMRLDGDGSGEGFRVFGPKLYGQGAPLKAVNMNLHDLEELSNEIKESIKFLKKDQCR